MKNILLFLTAFAVVACSDKPVVVGPATPIFTGDLTVAAATTFTMPDIRVDLTIENGLADIAMQGIKFSERMPPIDITIPGVVATTASSGVVTLSGGNIVPLYLGAPYPDRTVSSISGTVSAAGVLAMTVAVEGSGTMTYNGSMLLAE